MTIWCKDLSFYFRWILQEQNPRLSKTQNLKETHPSIEAAIVGKSKGSWVVVGRGTYLWALNVSSHWISSSDVWDPSADFSWEIASVLMAVDMTLLLFWHGWRILPLISLAITSVCTALLALQAAIFLPLLLLLLLLLLPTLNLLLQSFSQSNCFVCSWQQNSDFWDFWSNRRRILPGLF